MLVIRIMQSNRWLKAERAISMQDWKNINFGRKIRYQWQAEENEISTNDDDIGLFSTA